MTKIDKISEARKDPGSTVLGPITYWSAVIPLRRTKPPLSPPTARAALPEDDDDQISSENFAASDLPTTLDEMQCISSLNQP